MADYGYVHNGTVFTPDQTVVTVEQNDERNAAIEQAELAEWRMRPRHTLAYYHFPADQAAGPRPYRALFFPRLTGARVTTWLGSVLGTITRARVYPHNRGGRFISVHVRATNGAEYHGRTSYDGGSCIVLHRCNTTRR